MEVMADKRLTVTTAIADGMSLRDYPNIKSKVGKDVYCFFFTGVFYAIMGHPGPRRKKFLAKISGRTPEEADRILYGKATWKSWKNQDYALIGKKTDYTLFSGTHMFFVVWRQGKCGQKTFLKPGEIRKFRISVYSQNFFGSRTWRPGGGASGAFCWGNCKRLCDQSKGIFLIFLLTATAFGCTMEEIE